MGLAYHVGIHCTQSTVFLEGTESPETGDAIRVVRMEETVKQKGGLQPLLWISD
jgi:hypothetical protein